MVVLRITPECEAIIDRNLYLLSLLLSGLKNRKSPILSILLCEGVGHAFCKNFGVERKSWIARRTFRCLLGADATDEKNKKINEAVDFLMRSVNRVFSEVYLKELTRYERSEVISQLTSEVICDHDNTKVLGFFYDVDDFSDVRDAWVLIGYIAHLLCVFCEELDLKVFISHGLNRETLSWSLVSLEYVVLIA